MPRHEGDVVELLWACGVFEDAFGAGTFEPSFIGASSESSRLQSA